MQRSLSVAIEALPTPVSARSAFWWTQAGGPHASFLPSSPDTEDEEDEVSSGSYDHGHASSHGHSRRGSTLASPEANGNRNDRIEVMRVKNLFSGSPESVEVIGQEADSGLVFSAAVLGEQAAGRGAEKDAQE